MQKAIIGVRPATITGRPSLDGPSSVSSSYSNSSSSTTTGIARMAAENPVLVVGRRGCFMIHVIRRLLQGLGVNPAVCEVGEEDAEEAAMVEDLLADMAGGDAGQRQMLFPAVFIGGRLVGGLDRLMAVHISGDLVPILKDAGALWL